MKEMHGISGRCRISGHFIEYRKIKNIIKMQRRNEDI